MELRGDDRGQSIQVGAILIFAMLIVAMSVYQAQVVPQENAEIEWDSYLDASSDMTKLRNDVLGVAATDNQRGTTVTTGTNYPARVFFVNPGPATGRIQTGDPENLTLSNVKSASSNQNVDRYFQNESSTLEYQTRDVRFVPNYNEINDQVAPVVIANGFTYRNYSTPIPLTTQTIIQENRLTFVTVEGDFEAGGISTPITTDPVSAHTRTVTVTNRTSDPLVLTIPTPIPPSTWETDVIAGQMDPSGTIEGQYVTDVTDGPRPNTVNITLEPGANYELRLGRVELHEKTDVTEVAGTDARYLVAVTDTNTQTNRQGRVALTVEARDSYNNPVSNTNVTFEQPTDQGVFESKEGDPISFPIRTDENGRATVYYNATGHLGDIPVDAWLGTSDPAALEREVRFSVFNKGSGTSGSTLVVLNKTKTTATSKNFTFTLDYRGTNPASVTGYQLDHITKMASSGSITDGPDAIHNVTFVQLSETRSGVAIEARAPYLFENNPVTLSPGLTVDMTVTFDNEWSLGNKDALMISVRIFLEGDVTVTFTTFYISN